jgi:DNA-binding transcriptional ArsR family regulator
MSIEATTWAWKQHAANASMKLVLLALADAHNGKTGQCNPTLARISAETELGQRNVRYHLRALERLGLIATEQSFGRRSSYRFPSLEGGNPLPGLEDADPGKMQHFAPGKNRHASIEPEVREPEERERRAKRAPAPARGNRLPDDFPA